MSIKRCLWTVMIKFYLFLKFPGSWLPTFSLLFCFNPSVYQAGQRRLFACCVCYDCNKCCHDWNQIFGASSFLRFEFSVVLFCDAESLLFLEWCLYFVAIISVRLFFMQYLVRLLGLIVCLTIWLFVLKNVSSESIESLSISLWGVRLTRITLRTLNSCRSSFSESHT